LEKLSLIEKTCFKRVKTKNAANSAAFLQTNNKTSYEITLQPTGVYYYNYLFN